MTYQLKDSERISVKPGLEEQWRESVGKNQDGYGHGVVEATVAVCAGLDSGESAENAQKRCHGLGITGFMAGCMAVWVVRFHPRGEEFRRWWNRDKQIGNEGEMANDSSEVLNPAILNIST